MTTKKIKRREVEFETKAADKVIKKPPKSGKSLFTVSKIAEEKDDVDANTEAFEEMVNESKANSAGDSSEVVYDDALCEEDLNILDSVINNSAERLKVPIETISKVCELASKVLDKEPNLLHLKAPLAIVGDIHGQSWDLKKILNLAGDPSTTRYLFLGDYVDRGSDSIGVITTLLALKARYPRNVFLLRGNHECRHITSMYGFEDECINSGMNVYDTFCDIFNLLPLAAVIQGKEKKAFASHGGISSKMQTLEDINALDRRQEIPKSGLMNDLTWNDPREDVESFSPNYYRGTGEYYGREAVKAFRKTHGFEFILRAHELAPQGYCKCLGEQVISVWSATNYGGDTNVASVLLLNDDLELNFKIFS